MQIKVRKKLKQTKLQQAKGNETSTLICFLRGCPAPKSDRLPKTDSIASAAAFIWINQSLRANNSMSQVIAKACVCETFLELNDHNCGQRSVCILWQDT